MLHGSIQACLHQTGCHIKESSLECHSHWRKNLVIYISATSFLKTAVFVMDVTYAIQHINIIVIWTILYWACVLFNDAVNCSIFMVLD
jgi:hypothetical protein